LGDPTPSQAGVQMTKAIIDIPGPLGISRLHQRTACQQEGLKLI
jgi:hypothetical protein